MRRTFNGLPVTWSCAKHPEKAITLYGLPSATVWCACGRAMKNNTTAKNKRK
jgi:hypothetical protein